MDAFRELRRLADDLTELGDTATAMLVRQAIDRFSDWKFEAAAAAGAGTGRAAQARAPGAPVAPFQHLRLRDLVISPKGAQV